MKIAEIFKSKDDLKTLYCSRELLNGDEVVEWAKKQGFTKCLDPKDMHVTIAYSKKKIDWSGFSEIHEHVVVPDNENTKRSVKEFKGGAIVLTFKSKKLEERWREFKDEYGASWDFPSFRPHVTITYDGMPEDLKLDSVDPFDGELEFGPEIMEEVKEGWKSKVKES